ncbi:MAG: hypothetical protein K6E59_00185, partial [Bacilli bacterium]|nr:hypothetical protein [Bacilli bacterium]
ETEFLKSIDPDKEFSFSRPTKDNPVVFFVQTGGSEIYFKDCYEDFPDPYFLLVQGKRNSLAAALEIKTFCAQKGKRCHLLMGEPKQIREQLHRFHKFYHIEKRLHAMKLGVIGAPSDWLIGSGYSPKAIKKQFGIDMVRIPMKEFLALVDERLLADTKAMKRFLAKTSRREDLRKSLYIHGALKRLVVQYGLSGFTLRCFDLLKTKQQTSCLAFGMLNDEGIVATCEGDVPSLLTMVLLQELTGKATFMANPSEFDFKKKEAIFAHCTCPFSMLDSYTLATHFESGLGIGIRGQFPVGEMTLVKLHPDLSKIRAMKCQLLDNPLRGDLCRSQIHVKFKEGLEPLLNEPYGNHVIFASGDIAEEVQALFAYLTER